MLCSHQLEILNIFGTFSLCTGPHILWPVLLGIIWVPNAIRVATPNDSVALRDSHLSASSLPGVSWSQSGWRLVTLLRRLFLFSLALCVPALALDPTF